MPPSASRLEWTGRMQKSCIGMALVISWLATEVRRERCLTGSGETGRDN
jgi:hypothetical protein